MAVNVLRMADGGPLAPSLFHGSCATHESYGLTCAGYEQLRVDHQDRCGLCGQASRYMNVDHDHAVAWSAVRGLLCAKCNAGILRLIDWGRFPVGPRTREYLMNPWYLAIQGEALPYDPRPSIRLADLGGHDLNELDELGEFADAYRVWKAQPVFEHPVLAQAMAYPDYRPVLRLFTFRKWGWPVDQDIAAPVRSPGYWDLSDPAQSHKRAPQLQESTC